jgi:hypothetical protein
MASVKQSSLSMKHLNKNILSETNAKTFFERTANKLDYKKMEDWYQITVEDIRRCGGHKLLKRSFDGTLVKALQWMYPEHIWLPWKFSQKVPIGFWNSFKNQKKFMDWLGKQLGFIALEDWYKLTTEIIEQFRGSGLLQKYNGSIQKTIESIFPEHSWIVWKFRQVPKGFWNNPIHQADYIEWLSKQLCISHLDDWYRVSYYQIQQLAPITLIIRYHGLVNLLPKIYPHHTWEKSRFSSNFAKNSFLSESHSAISEQNGVIECNMSSSLTIREES